MSRKEKICLLTIVLISSIILISNIQYNSEISNDSNEYITPKLSPSLDGAENILITEVFRTINVSGYDLLTFKDKLTILNKNNNPITSIFIPIHLNKSDNVIFCKAMGESNNSLLTERTNLVLNDFELITVYFDSPLLPHQQKTIYFYHSQKDSLNYYNVLNEEYQLEQRIDMTESIFPLLAYKAEGETIKTKIIFPTTSTIEYYETVIDLGTSIKSTVTYDLSESTHFNYLNPFLSNFNKSQKEVLITIEENTLTKMEFNKIDREINISPWGIIKIKENYILQNLGVMYISRIPLHVPYSSKNVRVYDEIGAIGDEDVVLDDSERFLDKKSFIIDLAQNRVPLAPLSKISFTVEYILDFYEYISINWFQLSIQIDLLTTKFEFLGKNQVIKLFIEGCSNLEYISLQPDAIIDSISSKIVVYNSEYVSPIQSKLVQFTFSIDLFKVILRPIIIALIILILFSLFVILFKTKKEREDKLIITKEIIPVDEIREFCSLFEEKNALTLEIRRAEEDAKRKKIAKKTYSGILNKNAKKIEQIKQELIPFKKILIETNETFETIIKKLDVLDAERESVNDSLTLLENRYKRGKLPSKAAYQKLLEDFMKRRRKIDKTIDKNIQQLRTYLL